MTDQMTAKQLEEMTPEQLKKKMIGDQLAIDLQGFTGTDEYHKLCGFSNLQCTDGIKYLAETAGAYWLVDLIASHQPSVRNPSTCKRLISRGIRKSLKTGEQVDSKSIISAFQQLQDMQFWTLRSAPTKTYPHRAIAECQNDIPGTVFISQTIPYTDFPFDDTGKITLYLANNVLYLPSEH